LYHYDSLGRIVETYDSGGKMFYTYNSNGQVVEAKADREDQPFIIKYEYDQNGLLIRETTTLTKWNTTYTDIVYEYSSCK
jgi:YD repeat-containing protein